MNEKGEGGAAYGIYPTTPEEVSWVAGLEDEVYSAQDAIPFGVLADWYAANPDGFNIVRKGDEKIGHVDILPLRPAALRRILDGEIVERDLRGEDLYPPGERGSIRDLYVESLAVRPRPGSSSAPAALFILANFASLVGRLCEPADARNVYAIAASGAGESLLRRVGFTHVKGANERADKHTLWGATFSDLTKSLSALPRRRGPSSP